MKQIKLVVMAVVGVVVSLGFLKVARADEWNYVRGELTQAQVRRLVAPGRAAVRRVLQEFEASLTAEDRQSFSDAYKYGDDLSDDLYLRIDEFAESALKMTCLLEQEPYFSDDEDPYCIDDEGNGYEPLELREVIWDRAVLRVCTLYYRETAPAYDVQDCISMQSQSNGRKGGVL